MDIFKILGFCLCALVLLSVLRQYNPGYAVLAALACCMVLLWFVMQALGPVLSFVETLSQFSGFEHLGTVFKAVAIALMAQSVQDLCMEAGQTALAGRVELAGKVAVLLAAMPLFTVLTDTYICFFTNGLTERNFRLCEFNLHFVGNGWFALQPCCSALRRPACRRWRRRRRETPEAGNPGYLRNGRRSRRKRQ